MTRKNPIIFPPTSGLRGAGSGRGLAELRGEKGDAESWETELGFETIEEDSRWKMSKSDP